MQKIISLNIEDIKMIIAEKFNVPESEVIIKCFIDYQECGLIRSEVPSVKVEVNIPI